MRRTVCCGLAAFLLLSLPAAAETMKMKAELKGANEVPANTTSGTGMVDVTFDTATKALS